MKTIGLLGGMSWESSVLYEQLLNTEVRRRLGGTHSASLLVRSYDFAQIEALQERGDWDGAGELLATDARRLQDAGADLVLLCTNTMHRLAPQITAALTVPFLHIGEVTADAVLGAGLSAVGLLGTRYTMEGAFYRDTMQARGLAVIVPEPDDRTVVHDIIYDELVRGVIRAESRARLQGIVADLVRRGAEGVVAGCTEIELLLGADDVDVPYFPTTRLHALAAVEAALDGVSAPAGSARPPRRSRAG